MRRKTLVYLVLVGLAVFLCEISSADVPHMINYQGKLTTADGGCLNDTVQMTFSIYDDSLGMTPEWTETQTEVVVKEGVFSVLLGAVDSIPAAVFDGSTKYLGVQVESDPEMRPLKRMVSVAYAYRSSRADTASYAHAGDDDWAFRVTDTADTTLITGGEWGIARYGNILHGNADSTHVNLGVACTTGASDSNDKYATVGGGMMNTARGLATVGGGEHNAATGASSCIGGGTFNTVSHSNATVGGGGWNVASGWGSVVGGGDGDTASGDHSTVCGGKRNAASDQYATVGGGHKNRASATAAAVGGGEFNRASGQTATIGGGSDNIASGEGSTVGGGSQNVASGRWASVPGGQQDTVAGDFSLAAGKWVRIDSSADHTLAFGRDFITSTPNAVIFHNSVDPIRVGIGTTEPQTTLHVRDGGIIVGMGVGGCAGSGKIVQDCDLNLTKFQTMNNNVWSDAMVIAHTRNVGIGTVSPQGALDVNSTTGAFIVPRMTTAQRDALTAVNGMIIYNTATNQFNFYENGAWVTK